MDAIADRIAHGVKVRLLLGRPLGSYELNYNRWTLTNFTEAGIPAAGNPSLNLYAKGLWAASDFTYQHCKYTIVDNKTLVISSGNWSPNSCPTPRADGCVRGNRDWWFVVYGDGKGILEEPKKKIDGYFGIISISIAAIFTTILIFSKKRKVILN